MNIQVELEGQLYRFRASAENTARICHPHPTYTEATKEATLAVHGRALHI